MIDESRGALEGILPHRRPVSIMVLDKRQGHEHYEDSPFSFNLNLEACMVEELGRLRDVFHLYIRRILWRWQ